MWRLCRQHKVDDERSLLEFLQKIGSVLQAITPKSTTHSCVCTYGVWCRRVILFIWHHMACGLGETRPRKMRRHCSCNVAWSCVDPPPTERRCSTQAHAQQIRVFSGGVCWRMEMYFPYNILLHKPIRHNVVKENGQFTRRLCILGASLALPLKSRVKWWSFIAWLIDQSQVTYNENLVGHRYLNLF